MKRVWSAVVASAIVALAVLIIAGAAQADRAPVTDPLGSGTPNGSITLLANRCGFPVEVSVVANGEHQDVTTLPDGTTIAEIRGRLVLSFTNLVTGKTIVRNVSGPTTETDYPDHTGTFIARGNNWFGFGPVSQGNTGEPGLVFTSGVVTLGLGPTGVTSFSLSGKQENGCTLLVGH